MQTSLKTGVAQIFSCCPKNLSCPKFGGAAAPLAPLARTPMLSGVMKCNVKLKVKLFKQAGIHTVYASQSNYLYIKNIELH